MIKLLNDYFILETNNTSYIFYKEKSGHLIHLYYGDKIDFKTEDLEALKIKMKSPIGNANVYSDSNKELMLEVELQEVTTLGKGDFRTPEVLIEASDGFSTNDFIFKEAKIDKVIPYKDLPCSKDDGKAEALYLTLIDENIKVELTLCYTVFIDENVITRKTWVKNLSKEQVKIKKFGSMNLDMKNDNYVLRTFHGEWANEMNLYDQKLVIGKISNASLCGVSSARCNQFFMLYKDGATEDNGKAYGFNLIYSGNHSEEVEVDSLNNVRIINGINPLTFSFTLKENEVFEVPEAVMSYSSLGFNSLSQNFHQYIKEHIVDKEFKNFPRQVLNNSWEACYFNFNESKLLKMARCAKSLGVELFVLDDGWFKGRLDDTAGLGDWVENKKKLPHGLKGLSERINKIGLDFGIWVEPEMVNENSDLYRSHPEWVLWKMGVDQAKGRNQMILDLTNKEVEDCLFNSMCYVFTESNCKYVKWDMNRCFTDYYSNTLDKDRMEEVSHRYYLGLYSLFRRLKEKFPHILFEGCASGGNRFDLGILSYMPQIWASDDTDPFVRMRMQYNYSYGYPLSTLGCHTASSPCMTTIRRSTIETRFNVALYGAFGYEIDLRSETKEDKKKIINQIIFYKSIRERLISSDFYRLKNDSKSYQVEAISKDKSLALITDLLTEYSPVNAYSNIKVIGLDKDSNYSVTSSNKRIDIKSLGNAVNYVSPIKIRDGGLLQAIVAKVVKMEDKGLSYKTSGSILLNNGINVNESFSGCGFNSDLRIMTDFDSRLYIIEKV